MLAAARATLAAFAAAAILAACATTGDPTYTNAQITLARCPGGVRAHARVRIPFRVVNRSDRPWPATYVLLSLQEAAKGGVGIARAPTELIGGGITRVTSPLRPGAHVAGAVTAYLIHRGSGTVTVGAWGAPANSVAVPAAYRSRSCTLRP